MKQETKKERVNKTIKILTSMAGQCHTINMWLENINQKLSRKCAYKNTKELAQAFRYIKYVMKYPIVKEQKQHVSYTLIMETIEVN